MEQLRTPRPLTLNQGWFVLSILMVLLRACTLGFCPTTQGMPWFSWFSLTTRLFSCPGCINSHSIINGNLATLQRHLYCQPLRLPWPKWAPLSHLFSASPVRLLTTNSSTCCFYGDRSSLKLLIAKISIDLDPAFRRKGTWTLPSASLRARRVSRALVVLSLNWFWTLIILTYDFV